MDKIRFLVAIVLIAFGIEHFIVGDFIAGRAPAWPPAIPGRLAWAYVSGLALILAGLAIFLQKRARLAATLAGLMILIWAGLRHIPGLAANLQSGGDWTSTGKAFAMCGCAFIVADTFPEDGDPSGRLYKVIKQMDKLLPLSRFFIGLFMILCGIEHFIYTDFCASLVPAWIPGHIFWTYFAGIALIAGGAGLVLNIKTKLAATLSGIMIGLWVVLLHAPRAIISPGGVNEWTSFFEATALTGALLILGQTLAKRD